MNLAQAQAAITAKARSLLGTPYVYGKTDCEWLTRQCAATIGVTIPWGATEQYDDPHLPHVLDALEPGDFVYFHDLGDPPGEDHCGVYISPGLMIDSPYTGAVVRYDPFSLTGTDGVLQYIGAIRVAALATVPAKPTLMLTNPYTRGLVVADLQTALNKHGGKVVVDGIFGPLTEAAVKVFQKVRGLMVDGVVGPVTWSKLS
jgi:cell wall-associated NlpC family hydrolase